MEKRLPQNRINQIVFEHLHKFSIDTFIETGIYEGSGICNAQARAKEIYSIELDEARYQNALKMFAPFSNIHVLQGDSADILPEIMPELTGRCLFWLDAHYGDNEALGEPRTPILDELRCVLKYPHEFIILIDDARMYTGEGGWPALKTLETLILESRPDCNIEIKDDIIRVIPKNIIAIAEDKFISMSSLGSYGRFGNQLFQYAALKIYAATNGLRVEVPDDWIGRGLFCGCNDLPVSEKPREQKMLGDGCIWLNGQQLEGCDIKGYCQYHTIHYVSYKDYFRSLFNFIPPLERVLKEPIAPLRQGTLIGIHIRLSDYRLPGRSVNIAPIRWYLDWLRENWGKLDNPTLFIASDEIDNVIEHFREYQPNAFSAGANFLFDYYTLAHCDCLLISNSTFSFTAAMLNEEGKEFYRPDFGQKKLVSFEPWNSKPILEPV